MRDEPENADDPMKRFEDLATKLFQVKKESVEEITEGEPDTTETEPDE